jgi:HSP20 family protein
MSSDEDVPDWLKKRRYPLSRDWFFEDTDNIFREMEKMMEEEFKAFTSRVPKDYVRERKLPDGSTAREWGPFVYGHSVKIGPDGKPEVHEFGNVKQSSLGPEVKEEREPLVDVIKTDGEVHIVAELPGVEKNEIKLHATEDTLVISVDTPQHKYYKEVKFPAKVKVKEAKTQYKNGVLEITLPKTKEERKPEGEPINIE